ncbi:MAG: aminopeptidase P N-terminal domain-containing protein [Opitutaceae bacterium]|nr:aminopeptidase P N-terminal domain-containing protein [Cytophagales bacterium]
MRNFLVDPEFYKNNRKHITEKQAAKSISVINSNYQMPTNADGSMPFVQNSDIFYLTGINQEDTTLLLFPDAPNEKFKEILFIRYADEHVLTWEGHKLSKEQARDVSGIETVVWHSEFERVFKSLVYDADIIYINSNEHRRADNIVKNRDDVFLTWCKEHFPLHEYKRLAPILLNLRSIKYEAEIKQIEKACSITKSGFERAAKFLKPGVFEYELEAEFSHEFIKNGSKGFAYQPIIASGADSCVLHYISNHKQCLYGEIVLLDVAAEYNNYKSDLTRVLPVNGKFTNRQKDVYNAVLRMMRYAITLLKPGTDFEEYTKLVGQKAEEELLLIGILKSEEVAKQLENQPLYRKYFMHGVSHFLGLDVHDVGIMRGMMKPGMLLTCEPGLYLKEEGIGIRLENNILITDSGNIDLMANIPVEIEEIEDLMLNV